MPEPFLGLPTEEQGQLLRIHAEQLGMAAHIVEKDIWVCWALDQLFKMPDPPKMAFKGGTSLSKVYNVIDRFSEDIDVSFDIHTFVDEIKPQSKTKLKELSEEIKEKLCQYNKEKVKPYFEQCLGEQFDTTGYSIDLDSTGEKLNVNYLSAVQKEADHYIADRVLLEFGGRNITEPSEPHTVKTYLSKTMPDFALPEAKVSVLALTRTYWEKATLIHVACNRNEVKGADRLSRHWYDLFRLSEHQEKLETEEALKLLKEVVEHKNMFFYTSWANYQACLEGGLRLVPEGELRKELMDDFQLMTKSGMFYRDPPDFDTILDKLNVIQERLNKLIPSSRR
jgi:predicted nucleotidyltransferase component of viral defense system